MTGRGTARHRTPGYTDRENRRSLARYAALNALARKHPAEFAGLYARALADGGWTDPDMTRPCPCGTGVIRRRVPRGRWPARCAGCKEGMAT